jgi:hypothetical protein
MPPFVVASSIHKITGRAMFEIMITQKK